MKLRKVLKFIGLGAVMGFFACGATSCSDDDKNADGVIGSYTVTGVVTDEQSTPIAGVEVSYKGIEEKTTTNEDGVYTLNNVPLASGIVTFAKDGYQTTSVTVVARKFDANGVAKVDVEMVYASARIIGKVVDANTGGLPMEGVTVSVSATQQATTAADGTFEIRNLILQDYTVSFFKEGYPTVTKNIGIGNFNDGVTELEVTMGSAEILRGLTKFNLAEAPKWYYNEYRGGRNAEQYPHWDWACNYMCTLEFIGDWEEQNEGTTLRIRNSSDDQRNNPADMEMFDSFVYGSKLITPDNHLMTIDARTHSASNDAPTYYGVQVVDLSEAEPQARLIGGVRTLASEEYVPVTVDLSEYDGKEVVIAIGTFRQQAGDYWKQLVLRRIAFTAAEIPSIWDWLPGTTVPGLDDWKLTMEMVRSTMPHTKKHFSGISPVSGNRDAYVDAYRSWRNVSHIGAEWSYMPLTKDPEVFPSEGYLIKTRSGNSVSTKVPESYFYAKFSVAAGSNRLTLVTRNFSSSDATFFKLTAITNDGTVTHLAPVSNTATFAESAADGCWKFIHESGSADDPDGYARFVYDLSQFDGKDVFLTLGVFKGEANGGENKLVIYSIDVE